MANAVGSGGQLRRVDADSVSEDIAGNRSLQGGVIALQLFLRRWLLRLCHLLNAEEYLRCRRAAGLHLRAKQVGTLLFVRLLRLCFGGFRILCYISMAVQQFVSRQIELHRDLVEPAVVLYVYRIVGERVVAVAIGNHLGHGTFQVAGVVDRMASGVLRERVHGVVFVGDFFERAVGGLVGVVGISQAASVAN